MKKGDLVYNTRRKGIKKVGVVLGFSVDFLINRYDIPQYRVLWQNSGQISESVSAMCLKKVTNESR